MQEILDWLYLTKLGKGSIYDGCRGEIDAKSSAGFVVQSNTYRCVWQTPIDLLMHRCHICRVHISLAFSDGSRTHVCSHVQCIPCASPGNQTHPWLHPWCDFLAIKHWCHFLCASTESLHVLKGHIYNSSLGETTHIKVINPFRLHKSNLMVTYPSYYFV